MYKLQVSGLLRLSLTDMVLCPLFMGPCAFDVLRRPVMKQRYLQTSKTTAGSSQSQSNVSYCRALTSEYEVRNVIDWKLFVS